MARELAVAVAAAPRTRVEGRFERHTSLNRRDLTGSDGGGRWGVRGAYSVLYLGRPRASVTVEAYRHLVDPFVDDGMTGDLVVPRRLLVCEIAVNDVLDLREPAAQALVGLTAAELTSPTGDYEACQRVGQVAHQLGLHGVIAPAATRLGETLAVFEQHLEVSELPRLVGEETWEVLPPDPRRLQLVRDEGAG